MDFIQGVQQYWMLILFIGGVIASWARYEIKITNLGAEVKASHEENKKEIEKLQVQMESIEKNSDVFRERIGTNIQEIQTTMKFILEAINDMKKK